MRLPKDQIVQLFMRRDDVQRAEQADEGLPDWIDLREDAEALRALGLDPGLLATQIDNLEA